MIDVTPYTIGERFLGIEEASGPVSNPMVLAMLRLDAKWVEDDETPWCSAYVNYVCWLLRLPRSKSLAARSWLAVGEVLHDVTEARVGFDVVIFSRGSGNQPGPGVLRAPGHVGFFGGYDQSGLGQVWCLGGNQGDSVSIAPYHLQRVLGFRRLR
jgi:uncharacterized protein (TIGR02594 family)